MKTIEGGGFMESPTFAIEEIQKIEDVIKKRMPIGNQASVDDITQRYGSKYPQQLM